MLVFLQPLDFACRQICANIDYGLKCFVYDLSLHVPSYWGDSGKSSCVLLTDYE